MTDHPRTPLIDIAAERCRQVEEFGHTVASNVERFDRGTIGLVTWGARDRLDDAADLLRRGPHRLPHARKKLVIVAAMALALIEMIDALGEREELPLDGPEKRHA